MQKIFLLALFVAFSAAVQREDEAFGSASQDLHPHHANMTHFHSWMKEWLPHTKMLHPRYQSIKDEHLEERYNNWKQTVKFVYEHNLKNESWQAGLNMFSHLTDDEFRNMNWGLNIIHDNVTTNSNMPEEDFSVKRGEGKEWKGTSKVRAVRNQAACGSCWAFSAAAALEGGLNADLNPQQIIDCANLGACQGGDPLSAVRFGAKGMTLMAQYNSGKYDAKQESCKGQGSLKCTGAPATVRSGKDSDLDTLLNTGPVSVCINADGLKNYRSGIASAPCTNKINHAVLATGYTSTYFNVKNSWGERFGEKGYFKFPHSGNHCGISSRCVKASGCTGGHGDNADPTGTSDTSSENTVTRRTRATRNRNTATRGQ